MEIKQSINKAQVVGTLKEMNMEETTKEVVLKGNGVEKKITCQQIAKKDFKNPMFTVEVNGQDVGVDFFPISEKKLDENGSIIDNPRFKAMQTVMNTYIPKIRDAENATRVRIDGSLRANEYVDKTTFEYKSFAQINGFAITSSGVSEEDVADAEISGVIRSVMPEMKNEENTGRNIVELYTFDNQGVGTPFKFILDKDLVDDFNSFYEIGNSVKLYYEIVVRQVGATKPTSNGGFGRRESKMVSGYNVTEYSIFRGDDPFTDENELYVSIDAVKQAEEERAILIEKRIKEAKEKPQTTTSNSPKGASASSNSANPFSKNTDSTSTTKRANPFN